MSLPDIPGLKVEVTQQGAGGPAAQRGDAVAVHYRGVLEDGKQFDASYDRGDPLRFSVGNGQVIKGWDEGILGMTVGEKRKLTIAPDLAYGDRGIPGVIPQKATLIFDTELVSINGKSKDEL